MEFWVLAFRFSKKIELFWVLGWGIFCGLGQIFGSGQKFKVWVKILGGGKNVGFG